MQLTWHRDQRPGNQVVWADNLLRPAENGDKVYLLEKLSFYLQVATINQVIKMHQTSNDIKPSIIFIQNHDKELILDMRTVSLPEAFPSIPQPQLNHQRLYKFSKTLIFSLFLIVLFPGLK